MAFYEKVAEYGLVLFFVLVCLVVYFCGIIFDFIAGLFYMTVYLAEYLFEKIFDFVFGLFFTALYPAGCIRWIGFHGLRGNWHFLIISLFGVISAYKILAALVHKYIPDFRTDSWALELKIYGAVYILGLVAFVISGLIKNGRNNAAP